jgi:hypothetical protein
VVYGGGMRSHQCVGGGLEVDWGGGSARVGNMSTYIYVSKVEKA